jgi:hypothetical protein
MKRNPSRMLQKHTQALTDWQPIIAKTSTREAETSNCRSWEEDSL